MEPEPAKDSQSLRVEFIDLIAGIEREADRFWYASVLLNRLMFVYFIQGKGFLDGDVNYLRNRLTKVQALRGKGEFQTFYRHFLLKLFHDGFGKQPADDIGTRTRETDEGHGPMAVLQRQADADPERIAILRPVAIGAEPLGIFAVEGVLELPGARIVDQTFLLVFEEPFGQRFPRIHGSAGALPSRIGPLSAQLSVIDDSGAPPYCTYFSESAFFAAFSNATTS